MTRRVEQQEARLGIFEDSYDETRRAPHSFDYISLQQFLSISTPTLITAFLLSTTFAHSATIFLQNVSTRFKKTPKKKNYRLRLDHHYCPRYTYSTYQPSNSRQYYAPLELFKSMFHGFTTKYFPCFAFFSFIMN